MRNAGPGRSRSLHSRWWIAAALFAASTCRPPDLTASGGCIPGVDRVAVREEPEDAADAGGAAVVAAIRDGGDGAAVVPAPAVPALRVRVAVRSGAARAGATPVGRDDPFVSRLAASLGTRPLFTTDPDIEALAERLARSAAGRDPGAAVPGDRTTRLEPFLVVTISFEASEPGAPVREPTYVVRLDLAIERTPADGPLETPPAVRWELELPARAVR